MIGKLVQGALRQRFLTLLGGVGIIALGLWALSHLKVEAYPDISELQVVVISLYPGHAAEEVEQQVTVPVERALNSVPNAIARRSRTIFGLSVVDLTFEHDMDQNTARQMVLEKLRDVEVPDGVDISLAPPTTPAGELYRYTIEGPGYDDIQFRELQDWVISPRLLQVPGVGDAFPFGGLVKEYQIEVEPLALYKYNLPISRIAEAVSANNQNAGGSMLQSGQQSMVVRGVGMIRSVADIENVVVESKNGSPVFVRDIGRVRIGAAPQTGVFGLDGATGSVQGIVVMNRGGNASEILAGIKAAIAELNATGLPDGVRIVPIYDRTELVGSTLRTVSKTLAEGFAIVFLVLLFFLGSLKAAIITATVIPLSLLFAFACMYFYGIPANLLSLGALDFGIIVDGTLVMVEFIVRRLEAKPEAGVEETAYERITKAALRIQRPVFFSVVILAAAYIPLFALERVEHRLFAPMAFTVCSALMGSLLLTLTLVPVLATFVFKNGCKTWRNPLLDHLTNHYEKTIRVVVGHPWKMVAATALVFVFTGALATRLGTEFLPHLDEGVIWIRSNLPPGVSLEKSAEIATRMRQIIAESPEVKLVTSQTGRQESNTEPFGPNRNEFLVALHPYEAWTSGKTKAQVVHEMSDRLRAGIPGTTFNFTQPIIDMVMEAVTGSSADLAVIVSGPDLNILRGAAGEVLRILREIPGAADAAFEQESDQPQLRILVDRQEVARHGINVRDVQEVIELAIGGRPVSTLFEQDRRFDIVVRYAPSARSTPEDIGNILVPMPSGGNVPLSRLASIRIEEGASIIARKDNRRQVGVRTNIRGRDQGSFVAEAQRRLRAELKLPPGYRVEWGGQFENLERARKRLAWILPVTVALIFALLIWTFGSAFNAALVLVNIPFSIVGGIAALYLRGIPFSVSAAVGFVSLFGVAVMSGVLYIAEMNRQRTEHKLPLMEAVVAGARAQLRPRLILIVVAMLGILPAAMATGIGSDIQRPLATVILGGLASTLLLALLAMPCMYYLVERRGKAHVGKAE